MSVPPTHRVSFADSDSIASIAYSADSREIFVALNVETISLWRVILNEWPYTIGSLSVIVMIAGAVLLRRVLARPRRNGRMYCRNCNHEIADRSVPCQECGRSVDERRALVRGRARWKRLAPGLTLMVAPMVIYGVLWVTPNSFYAPMWTWCNWWSDDALALARRHKLGWLERHAEPATRVAVVDVASGKRVRELGTFGGSHGPYEDMKITVSPDGHHLYIPDYWRDLVAINTTTGRVWRRLHLADSALITQIAGVTSDGETVYATFLDQTTHQVSLVRWDLRADRSRVIKALNAEMRSSRYHPQRFYLVPNAPGPTFIELSAYRVVLNRNIQSTPSTIRWFAEASPDDVSELVTFICHDSDPMPMGGDNCMGFEIQYSGIQIIDVCTGAVRTLIEPSTFFLDSPFCERGPRCLVFGQVDRDEVGVFDVDAGTMAEPSVAPRFWLYSTTRDITVAPDLTSFGAETFYGVGNGRPPYFRSELAIYDLTPYPKLRELEFGERGGDAPE